MYGGVHVHIREIVVMHQDNGHAAVKPGFQNGDEMESGRGAI